MIREVNTENITVRQNSVKVVAFNLGYELYHNSIKSTTKIVTR
jgi:hypothetical protein